MRYPLASQTGVVLAIAALGGCGTGSADDRGDGATDTPMLVAESVEMVADSVVPHEQSPPAPHRSLAPRPIRGLYLNAHTAGSETRLRRLLEIAETTEINTFVVDVKDELGIRYPSEINLAMELVQGSDVPLEDLDGLIETLKSRGIYTIARIVVFNDPLLSRARPDWAIRQEGGEIWLDRSDNSWVSPWDQRAWDYNIQIAEEVAQAGFDEIQFDYVRFPEQFQSLPPQVHPHESGDRTDAIAAFLNEARSRLQPLDVAIAADVFGLSPNTYNDVGIGQQWERLSAIVDHILPMMYPSHYLPTHLPNVPQPNAMPYETVYKSAGMARIRSDRLRESGIEPARVITWLQAFQATWLRDSVEYGPEEVRRQKQAVYDVGLDDWILWHPGARYEPFLPALDDTAESRAASAYDPPEDVLRIVDRFEELGVREERERALEDNNLSQGR